MRFNTVSILVANRDFLFGESENNLELNFIIETLKKLQLDIRNISIIKEDEKSAALELTILPKINDFVIVLAKPNAVCISKALGNITLQEYRFLSNREGGIKWPKSVKCLNHSMLASPILYFQRIFILEFGYVRQQIQHILKPHLTHYKQEVKYMKIFKLAKNGGRDDIEKNALDNVVIGCEHTDESDIVTLTSNCFEQIVNAEIMLKDKKGDVNGKWVNEMVELIYHSKDKHVLLAIDVSVR